jgi:hypothetical protein
MELFAHYATGVIDPQRHAVRLSESGRAVANGERKAEFYDETLPLLRDPIMQQLIENLCRSEERFIMIEQLIRAAADETGADDNLIRFHIGLLLKRGLLEISEVVADDLKDTSP